MNKKKFNILFVDDEEGNLRVFKSSFKWYYNIFLANSGEEGIQILNNEKIDLIITDQRMPNMTGVEFLEKIIPTYPNVPRIIVTGYTDLESIIEAVNNGRIFHYVTKPWEVDDLKAVIENALQVSMLKSENLDLVTNLKKANKQLTSALHQLDTFVYKASHDLKGPIATILGLSSLALKEPNNADLPEYLTKIDQTANKMDSLLAKLLIVNVINHDNLNYTSINLSEIVNDLIGVLEGEIIWDVNIDESINLISDEKLISVSLNNMVENSVNYTYPKRPCKIKIIAENDSKNNNILINVVDNGKGINNEMMDHVFNMFFRGDESSQGNGLGLYVVKMAINKLGGSVKIKNSSDEGTHFIITLPNEPKVIEE
ncbi:MAG: hybrid sensor histidine kinase/response regulator [Cyclobacteriaceae bacterium]|nr:hybrid sensor histidine kinase/response regulator [Cyclobacteriaceae bacterium]